MKRTLLILIVAIILGSYAELTSRLVDVERLTAETALDNLHIVPPSGLTKAFSFGHQLLAADLYWIKAVLYVSDIMILGCDIIWLKPLLELITDLDPYFTGAYIWGGAAFIYNGRVITKEAIDLSNWILEKGYTVIKDNWEIPFMLAINYYLEFRDFEKAALWMKRASDITGSPTHIKTLSASWLKKIGKHDEAVDHLKTELLIAQIDRVGDERVEKKIAQRLRQYTDDQDVDRLIVSFKEIGQRYHETFPFIPFQLFLQIDREHVDEKWTEELLQEGYPLIFESPGKFER